VGIEKAQVRSAVKQRNHILLALRAFLRLESHRLQTGISWYQAKFDIVRDAIHDYLAHPSILARCVAFFNPWWF
jgi:putative transposase